MITVTVETPEGDFISIKCYSEFAANVLQLLIETQTDCITNRPIQFRER